MRYTETLEQSTTVFASLELFCLLGEKKKKKLFFLLANADIGLIHADTFGIIIL